ncbi:PhzF family phenazine biosynthesis protein [Paracoccaceae bacterium]
MDLQRIAAFADGDRGGNPAGVVIADTLPPPAEMQHIAADLGYSETVFAAPAPGGWQVRYFAPEGEVAFCGHATIALGAELGRRFGPGHHALFLTQSDISVEVNEGRAVLTSPPTRSAPLEAGISAALLDALGLTEADLDPRLPLSRAHGGVDHAVIALARRERLAAMAYPFDRVKALMQQAGLTTISLIHIAAHDLFIARNAFAIGGVVEDPATGAAAAALGGLLVDLGWPGLAGGGRFTIRQGEDMGAPSLIAVEVSGKPGAPVRVGGAARLIL